MTAEERATEIVEALDVAFTGNDDIFRFVVAHLEGHGRQMVLDHTRIRQRHERACYGSPEAV